ncbi:MAG: CHAT domain-containing protein [Bacteroidota bacterium]
MYLVNTYFYSFSILLLIVLSGVPDVCAHPIDTSEFAIWREQVAHFNECKEYDSVLVYAEQARSFAEQHQFTARQLEFTCKQNLAHYRVYLKSSDPLFNLLTAALPVVDQMLASGDSSLWTVRTLALMSSLYGFRHNNKLKKVYMDKALAAFPQTRTGISDLMRRLLLTQSSIHLSLNQLDSAALFLSMAKQHMRGGSVELEGWYGARGHLEYQKQNFLEAENYFLKQLHLADSLGMVDERDLFILFSLAKVNRRMGNYDRAAEFANQTRGGPRKAMLLANLYIEDEDYENAKNQLFMAEFSVMRHLGGNLNYLPMIYQLLGDTYHHLDMLDSVAYFYQKAFDSIDSIELRPKTLQDTMLFQYNQGIIRLQQNKYQEALSFFSDARANVRQFKGTFKNFESYVLYEQHTTYIKMDSLAEAFDALRKARHLLFSQDLHWGDSIQHQWYHDPQLYIRYLQAFGALHFRRYEQEQEVRDLDSALYFFDLVDQMTDTIRIRFRGGLVRRVIGKESYESYFTGINICHLLYKLSHDPSYLKKAFYYSEKSKSIRLAEAMQESQARKFLKVPDSLLYAEQSLRNQIQYLEQSLQKEREDAPIRFRETGIDGRSRQREALGRELYAAKLAYKQLLEEFERDHPAYFQQKFHLQPAHLLEVQEECIANKNGFLEYIIADSAIYCFLISPDTILLSRLEIALDVDSSIQELRNSLYSYWLSDSRSDSIYASHSEKYALLAHQLYQALLSPLRPFLSGIEQLTIIPDGPLAYLPFELLLTEQVANPSHFANHPYLLRQFAVTYGFSATSLIRQAIPSQARSGLLAIRPSFDQVHPHFASIESRRRDGFGPLRFSKLETDFLARTFGATVLEDSMATKEQVLRALNTQQFAFIHWATHAKSHDMYPRKAKIALTAQKDSTDDNDFLSFGEIFNLRLNADMVVLSACETGLGEFQEGEGVMSLARAFAFAGARSVVTTLWSVDDQSTAQLMTDFYTQLDLGAAKGQALQQAKLSFLQSRDHHFAHPFFWAGPVVIGDGGAIQFQSHIPLITPLLTVLICLLAFLLFTFRMRIFSQESPEKKND